MVSVHQRTARAAHERTARPALTLLPELLSSLAQRVPWSLPWTTARLRGGTAMLLGI